MGGLRSWLCGPSCAWRSTDYGREPRRPSSEMLSGITWRIPSIPSNQLRKSYQFSFGRLKADTRVPQGHRLLRYTVP